MERFPIRLALLALIVALAISLVPAPVCAVDNGLIDYTTGSFVHPGLLHTQADFDRISAKVAAGLSPWIDGYNVLIANSHASLSYTARPRSVVIRGATGDNSALFFNDAATAYALAIRWKLTNNTAYANKSIEVLNAWSATLTGLSGDNDVYLLTNQFYQFANAAEIMRNYTGWAADDFARFQNMTTALFYPLASYGLHVSRADMSSFSNWQLAGIAAIMSIGVLNDRRDIFAEAVDYWLTGAANGAVAQTIFYLHPGHFGQTQEAGRDQGHDTLSVMQLAVICEQAWNQGVDLYGYDNNRVLAGNEYAAKGNLVETDTTYYTVPFTQYIVNGNDGLVNFTVFSTTSRGTLRPQWSMVYHHYTNRRGIAAPYSKAFMTLTSPEGGGGNYGPNSGGYDQLGYGTLMYSRDPIAEGAGPTGLTQHVTLGVVTLSWWGSAYSTNYTVHRSSVSGGPYTIVASGIQDLLTYADSNLPDGTYYYVVTDQPISGESKTTNEVVSVVGQQLMIYLAFDEGSGTVAADSSGFGNNGTLVNATWTTGESGSAVALDGVSSCVQLPNDLLFGVGDFTISLWMYWTGINHGYQNVFSLGEGVDHVMLLSPRWSTGKARFTISLNGGTGVDLIEHTGRFADYAWVHIAVTIQGSVGTLYYKGSPVGVNEAMRFQPWNLGHTSENWLGKSTGFNFFFGKVDQFRIYHAALNDTQIADIAAEGI